MAERIYQLVGGRAVLTTHTGDIVVKVGSLIIIEEEQAAILGNASGIFEPRGVPEVSDKDGVSIIKIRPAPKIQETPVPDAPTPTYTPPPISGQPLDPPPRKRPKDDRDEEKAGA